MDLQDQIIQAAILEIEQKSWGATEQYMQIHDVVRINGIPKIERVDLKNEDEGAIAYLPVEGERFYLAIYFDTVPEVSIRYIGTEDYTKIYLRATSDTLTWPEITAMTTLKAAETFNNGDKRRSGTAVYKYSCANYEPNPGPDTFENKLKNLLDYLEQDKKGVEALVNNTDAYIQVDKDIHYGNGLIGGPHIDILNINRMAKMKLEISFSQYVTGNPFK